MYQDSNIGIPDIEGKTPLHWAASSKDSSAVDCVQLILVCILPQPNLELLLRDFEGSKSDLLKSKKYEN